MKTRIPIILVATLLAGACVTPEPAPRFTPAWERIDREGPGWHSTDTVLLVADCQIHNLDSQPLPERNLSVASVLTTAIRSPQLDLFATDVLAWILENGAPDAAFVLHLGDAIDLACEGEFETFLSVMETAGKPWFMAPGNHDFFYFGSYDPQDEELWESGCYGAGDNFTKDRFIRRYVAALVDQDEPSLVSLADALGVGEVRKEHSEVTKRIPEEFEWHRPEGSAGLLQSICWKINEEEPWRSFILQSVEIQLSDASEFASRFLILDSCQYQHQPVLCPNGWQSYPMALNCGSTGEMLPDQLRKIREWVEEAGKAGGTNFACHHPFDVLNSRTKSSLGWLWGKRRVGTMFTAHTHAGYFKHHDLGDGVEELELNVGSTTDWPMEWRVVQGFINPEEELIYVRAERGTLVDALSHKEGYFMKGWELPLDAPDDYRKYKSGEGAPGVLVDFYLDHHLTPKWLGQVIHVRPNAAARDTEDQIKETLIWTYARLMLLFPTNHNEGSPRWPAGCSNDKEVIELMKVLVLDEDETGEAPKLAERVRDLLRDDEVTIEEKIALIQELRVFERTRHSWNPETGENTDAERGRYKLSAAAWASRFESSQGRFLRIEDELIRIDWDKLAEREARGENSQ